MRHVQNRVVVIAALSLAVLLMGIILVKDFVVLLVPRSLRAWREYPAFVCSGIFVPTLKAVWHAKKAADKGLATSDELFTLGSYYESILGDTRAALFFYERGIRTKPASALNYYRAVKILSAADRHRDAIDLLLSAPGEFSEYWGLLAELYEKVGEPEQAAKCYGRAIALERDRQRRIPFDITGELYRAGLISRWEERKRALEGQVR